MKDRIIGFLLTLIIIGIIGAIGVLGYMVYTEITKDGTIEIHFEGESGFPIIEYIPSIDKIEILDDQMFMGIEDSNSTTTSTNIASTTQSRHLYTQLDDTAKAIYSELYKNKENLKTGTYKIDFGNAFQTLLSHDNGDVELKKQYQSAIEALVYENPDIFYLDVTKMYINIEKITKITGTRYNVYVDSGSDYSYLAEGFYSKEDIDKYEQKIEYVKNEILSQIEGRTDYQKIKLIHDYLIESVDYETNLQKENIYNMYGALVQKKCVCEGYAKAFQYLMNQIGIDNTIVIGTGTNSKGQTESHAWNYVKLDKGWFAVDVTWDDPIITGGGQLTNKAKYKYFLKGSNTMNKNHVPSGKFTEDGMVFEYPKLSEEDYK